MRKRLTKFVLPAASMMVLLASHRSRQEEGAAVAATGAAACGWPIGAAFAIGASAFAAAWAQKSIGTAGQGAYAERPGGASVVTLTALPEVIVLFGFVLGLLIAQG